MWGVLAFLSSRITASTACQPRPGLGLRASEAWGPYRMGGKVVLQCCKRLGPSYARAESVSCLAVRLTRRYIKDEKELQAA
eukprot:CAMPEP_0117695284 /NCGR_PEP_ID=MMETSP0804-20121206/28061_1 /TAXON_ID=1074897 /ORGANISM="Tetraselmis astigmatica, Strain CCMP880" /LENGTH=80 /DNA_ID=CAMNT_0005509353 /DNA_START=186 /DNA_END=426 /DNA_ORIENTATION=+